MFIHTKLLSIDTENILLLCFGENEISDLKRSGKSCRLRWMNYLSPNVKRGEFTEEEEDLIIRLHNLLGNRFLSLYVEKKT